MIASANTIVSEVPDRRRSERHTTVLRVARVITASGDQHLGPTRNIGAGGLMLETYAPLATGAPVRVEPKGCEPLTGLICWTEGKHAGVAFNAELDVEHYLHTPQALPAAQIPRCPRIVTNRRGRLRIGQIWHLVSVLDLSQGGAKVEAELPVEIGAAVELNIDELGPLHARIRWVRGVWIGLTFCSPLSLAEVARWAESLNRPVSETGDPEPVIEPDTGPETSPAIRHQMSQEEDNHRVRARAEMARAKSTKSVPARSAHLKLAELHRAAASALRAAMDGRTEVKI